MLGISIVVAIDSPGPILFRQNRPGLGGSPFGMLKFRTMRADAEAILRADPALYSRFLANDCKLPAEEDPRITKIGSFLRRSSLDELPQLINVLLGDMTLVGPRPVVGPELNHYGAMGSTVLSVRPGITGYWQVHGRSSVAFPERAEMDLHYISNWSLALDLRLLALTVPAVCRQRGAY
jgi:lipopolysaccharide/colanic/teichoic acid biosynthesis glycosyltransferase